MKETLQSYNTRLGVNNDTLDSILEQINNLPEKETEVKSTTFVQLEEPEETKGIWLQADAKEHDNFYMKYESNIYPTLVSSTSYPLSTYGHGAASVGRYTDIFGGLNSSYTVIKNAYRYDIVTNTFTSIANLPYYSHVPFVVAVGTNVYIIGGNGGTSTSTVKIAWNYKYDALTNTYTRMSDLPYAAHNIRGIAIGTDIYIFGGNTTASTNYAYKYNTLSDTYTQLTDVPYAMAGEHIVADKDYIYIFGGGKHSNGSYGMLKYSIVEDTYDFIPTDFGSLGNGGIYKYGNYVYEFGGYDGINGGSSNKIYKYNLSDNTYTEIGTLVTQIANFAFSVIDNIFLIFGGQTSNGASNYFQKKTLFPYDKPTIISTSKMWLYEDGENITENVPTYINNNDKWEKIN